jgi:hypothetical protein
MHTNRKLHSAKKDIDCTVLYPSCVLKNKNPALLFLKVMQDLKIVSYCSLNRNLFYGAN